MLTRSPIAAILLTVGVWFVFFIVGVVHQVFEGFRAIDRIAQAVHNKLGDEGLKALEAQQNAGPNGPDGGPGRPGNRVAILEAERFHENWFSQTVYVLHVLLPRTNDLYELTDRQIRHDLAFGDPMPPPEQDKPLPMLPGGIQMPQLQEKPPTLAETLGVSGAFIAVMLGVACWWFATKDY